MSISLSRCHNSAYQLVCAFEIRMSTSSHCSSYSSSLSSFSSSSPFFSFPFFSSFSSSSFSNGTDDRPHKPRHFFPLLSSSFLQDHPPAMSKLRVPKITPIYLSICFSVSASVRQCVVSIERLLGVAMRDAARKHHVGQWA